jgi:hypothetical protein
MTQARRQLVNPNHAGTYHCVNRCVRRSWLCGLDECTNQSFEHRKPWVEARILELGEIFACGIYAWAVMSNHLHLVVHMSPVTARDWSALEVRDRLDIHSPDKSDPKLDRLDIHSPDKSDPKLRLV